MNRDSCHYEGSDAWPCPAGPKIEAGFALDGGELRPGTMQRVVVGPHCHVEGCGWPDNACGFVRLGTAVGPSAGTALDLGCGLMRRLVFWWPGLPPAIPGDPTADLIAARRAEVPRGA